MEKIITVAFVNPPKSGGKRHSIKTTNGEFLGFDAAKLSFSKGGTYTVLAEEHEYNGKTYLTATRILEEQKRVNGAAPRAPAPERWWMPFVSNTVAHALQCGQITDPSQVILWAKAAQNAALELDRQKLADAVRVPGQDDEDIPY